MNNYPATAPSINRQDIVSNILDDYAEMGEHLDWQVGNSPVMYQPAMEQKDDVPFVPAHMGGLPSMKSRSAAVAALLGPLQLRVDKSRPTTPSSIPHKSISRIGKPPLLRLQSSNGSTAGTVTSPPLESPLEEVDLSPNRPSTPYLPNDEQRGRPYTRSSSVPPILDNSSPPPLPVRRTPQGYAKDSSSGRMRKLTEMGNKNSKIVSERGDAGTASQTMAGNTKNVLKVRNTNGSGRPTLADTMGRGLRRPRTAEHKQRSSMLSDISNQVRTQSINPTASVAVESRDTPSAARTEDTSHTDSTVVRHTSGLTMHEKEPSLSGGSDSAFEDGILRTPPKSILLPLSSSNPKVDDTPFDFGIVGGDGLNTPPEEAESIRQSMHSRGKTGSALDLFRNSARSCLHTTTPSPTLSLADNQPHRSIHPSPSHPVLSYNQSPHAGPRGYSSSQSNNTTIAASASTQLSTLPNISILNASRPPNTLAPLLNTCHLQCFPKHNKFHLSKNNYAPVPCMLCYAEGIEERWTCSWCALRICRACKSDLEAIKDRDLGIFIEGTAKGRTKTGMTTRSGISVKGPRPQSKSYSRGERRRSLAGTVG